MAKLLENKVALVTGAGSGIFGPHKTDPVLIVEPDAVLPVAILAECFKAVARGYPQRPERNSGVQLVELAFRNASQLLRARSARRLGTAPVEDVLRSLIIERADHRRTTAAALPLTITDTVPSIRIPILGIGGSRG